ncbi:MAG: DegT/DnrJ/EryC1/StrS family aminotransferase [Kiritimatiellaeota bacterium]|nr:DegT/DnrJ/EryC1/StrS family aminotransferase [Kiritimatiellota bacterium]
MSDHPELALNGGEKAFASRTGRAQPKVGVEEFLSIAERFGFKPDALERLRKTVGNEDLEGNGPNLARYICAFPAPPKGEEFERLAKEIFGVQHALSITSGTAALHCAFHAVGVGPGAEVILPALGFMATSSAVALLGGKPVFCDVDESLQMDPARIEPLITEHTVALAPTHHWGTVCDMDPILEVARRHNLKVIEDCAQAPGARYRGRHVGTLGDIGCFSISAYKIIGGGEGGLVITDDEHFFARVCQLAECGGLWRPDRFGPPRWEGELFPGTNYRLSELESAVDVIQLRKLENVVGRYRRVSRRILRQLRRFEEITPQKVNDSAGEIGYMLRFFPARFELGVQVCEALRAEGIGASMRGPNRPPDWHIYSDMVPVVGADPQREWRPGRCPRADDLFARCIGIGVDQWWSDTDADCVAAGINKVLAAYCTPADAPPGWL